METLRGPEQVSETKMLEFMEAHLTDPDFSVWVTKTYYILGHQFNLRPEIMLLQAMKETNKFQSPIFKNCYNFAGVGVTGDISHSPWTRKPDPIEGTDWWYDKGTGVWISAIISPNPLWGALCHFYHMLVYVDPIETAIGTTTLEIGSFYNHRMRFTWSKRGGLNAQPAVTLANLAGTWAKSLSYAQDLQRDYNFLVVWTSKTP